VPQITSVKEGVGGELDGHWGRFAGAQSEREIGAAVVALLRDENTWLTMGRKARQAHLQQYNYELQFSPVMQRLFDWCGKRCPDALWPPTA
jgi:hypothetical protein